MSSTFQITGALRLYKAKFPLVASDADRPDPDNNPSDCDYTSYRHAARKSTAELELLREFDALLRLPHSDIC